MNHFESPGPANQPYNFNPQGVGFTGTYPPQTVQNPVYPTTTVQNWQPRLDILEDNREVILIFEIPGVIPEEIEIETTPNSLSVHGKTAHLPEETNKNITHRERPLGNFLRSISLPTGLEFNEASASYTKGLLQVRIPRENREASQRIPINNQEVNRTTT